MNERKKIVAGIVTYNPDLKRLEQNISAILPQVGMLIISDNGSSNYLEIEKLCNKIKEKILIIHNTVNKGIAYALNQIFEHSIKDGYKYTLTLDQDSIAPNNLINVLSIYLNDEIAIVCPFIKDINKTILNKPNEPITYINRCITSGSLTLNDAWKRISGFDEEMFIDGVDFDFCDRLKKSNYKLLMVNDIELTHEIGKIQTKKILGINIEVMNHSAFRKYYIAKNIVYLDRKNKEKLYPFKTYLRVLKQMFLVLFFEDDKKNKLIQLVKGARDGSKVQIIDKTYVNEVQS